MHCSAFVFHSSAWDLVGVCNIFVHGEVSSSVSEYVVILVFMAIVSMANG